MITLGSERDNTQRDCTSLVTQTLIIFYLQVKDIEVNPVVNRDLTRRVRAVSGITVAKQLVRDDIKLAAKLALELDTRMKLYEKKTKEEMEAKEKEKEVSAEVSNWSLLI